MPGQSFDDPAVQAAMRRYLKAVADLADAADPRDIVDHADAKVLAGLTLRKRLEAHGWIAPSTQRTST